MVRFARLPLSPYQRDIWVAAAQFPELDQYTIFSYDRFTGEVDTQALERALLQAARDTEAFRLRLGETDGTPYQWLDTDAEFEARHVDLRADRDPEAAVRSWLRDAFRHAYPLDGRSLVDLALLHSDQALYVYVRTHHIVSDAWGLQLFLSRVRAGYLGELGEPQAQMPTASLLAQLETDDYSGSEQYRGDRAYFAEALEGLEPALFTRRRPAGLRRTARHRLTLERTLLDAIRDRGESPFLFLSAAVALYLARIHQNDDVVLGVPVLNRADRAAKQVVGHFANTLPLRIRTAPEQTVDEFLAQLREATRTLLRHQKMPLGDLLRGASPLFDTTLSYMRWPAAQAIPNASVETVAQTHAHDPDALAIWVSEFDGHSDAQVDFEYACDVFDADFPMDAAARHIETFLRALVEGGERRLGELDPLSAAEREELIHTRNATDQAFPEQATLPTLFAEQVARTPQRTALLEADGGTLSYAELDAKVQAVADALRAAGVRTDERVALLVARGPHLLPAILGVQRAGGAYAPINPDHPLERVRLLLEDCGARVVLVDERAATLGESLGETRVLHLERLPQSTGDLPAANVAPGDLAYVIYTSGSTGMPKGVMVEHRSVVNRLNWMQRRYPIGERDVLLQKTPVTFDVSVWELFWWSFTGARLSLLPPGAEKDPREMLRSIQRDAVTVIHFVPSMLTPFLDLLDGDPTARAAASSLRLVFCSGEALAPLQVARFRRLFGDAVRLVNLYGPTEATVDVSDHECASDNPTRVPIGRPIDNLRLYVLDRALRPQPLGAVGELYIGGVGVARGYLNRPELNAERFLVDPFVAGGRLYRTGDLARWLADGNLEYLGRADDQVKIRGNRVEPDEVRDRLAALPGVRDAAVVARDSAVRGTHLVGYYVAAAELDPGQLRAGLSATLPDFMLPAFFVRIDSLPLSANGKLDRRQLPAPPEQVAAVAPRTATEAELAAVWADVLGVAEVGVHDDFYALGGDSILMLRIRAAAQRRGLGFELADLMRNPTVAGLAERLVRPLAERSYQPFELVSEVDKPRLEGLEDAFPTSRLSLGLLFHSRQRPDSSVYHDVFHYRFDLAWDEAAFRHALDRVVAAYPALRSSFDLSGASEPLQLVHTQARSEPLILDLRGNPEAGTVLDEHIRQRRFHRYSLQQPGLFLFAAFVREDGLDLVFSFHHAILDGWSVANLIVALVAAYRGEPLPGPAPALACHVREELAALASPAAVGYWTGLLEGARMTRLDGFGAHEPQAAQGPASHREALPDGLLERLKATAAQRGLPLKSLLLAAHCLTLHLFSRSDSVVTGAISNGRPELPDADRMVGLFLNTVPVRSEIAGCSWIEVADALFRQERDGHAHRRYPLSAIQQIVGDELSSAFNYVNLHVLEPLWQLRDFRVWEETNFALLVNVIATPSDGMYLRIDSDGRGISRSQAALIGATFVELLWRLADHPDEAADFAFLAPRRDAASQPEPLVDVVSLFERQVEALPGSAALAFEEQRWTYRDLDHVARCVATRLVRAGARRGDAIGVALNRSPEMIATIWGILRAGLVCVPLDVSYPAQRLALILETAQPFRVVAHPEHAHVAAAERVLPVEELVADIEPETFAAPQLDELAMLLFTSGSTGRPKGVELSHRMSGQLHPVAIARRQRRTGAAHTAVRAAELRHGLPGDLLHAVRRRRAATHLQPRADGPLRVAACPRTPPGPARAVALRRPATPRRGLQRAGRAPRRPARGGVLRRAVAHHRRRPRVLRGDARAAAGEPVRSHRDAPGHLPLAERRSGALPGPAADRPAAGRGRGAGARRRAAPGTGRRYRRAVLRRRLPRARLPPRPQTHRRALRRTSLAPRRQALPHRRPRAHPRQRRDRLARPRRYPGQGPRLPHRAGRGRAGDHAPGRAPAGPARRGGGGSRAPGQRCIPRCLPARRARGGGSRRTEAGTAQRTAGTHGAGTLRLGRRLRPHPQRQARRRRPARTAAGARDEHRVPGPARRLRAHPGRTPRRVAGSSRVGIRDSFFDLGGTSLSAMRFMLLIEKRYGVDLPMAALIETPTVEGLAERLRERSAVRAFDPLVPIRAGGSRPPLFLVHPLGGHVLCYLPLVRALPPDQPVYALQAAGTGQGSTPLAVLEDIAASYLAAIRRVQPEGPDHLGGWSFGGFVAYEMARQLRALDPQAVAQLIVLDSITVDRNHAGSASDEALLLFFYWELVWFERSDKEVEPLPEGASLEQKLDHIVERAIEAGVLPAGTPRATVQRLYELFRASWQALIGYRPEVSDQDMTLLRADGPLPLALKPMHDAAGTHYGDPKNGWQHWTSGRLDVIDVPGDHLVLMKEPYVETVAAEIAALLEPSTSSERTRP
ncbi:D-alanine--D-alanyl carrier protein ligase [Pseudomonas aeruginosa]